MNWRRPRLGQASAVGYDVIIRPATIEGTSDVITHCYVLLSRRKLSASSKGSQEEICGFKAKVICDYPFTAYRYL